MSGWRALGYLYLSQDAEDRALAAWRHNPAMVEEMLVNGVEAAAAANHDEALVWYGRATSLDTGSVDGWLSAGSVLEARGDWTAAIDVYATGASSTSNNSDLLFRSAQAQRLFSPSIDWSAVLALLDSAIEVDRFLYDWNRVQSHHLRGEALRTLGRPREALAEYSWVMEHRPGDYWATLGRADLIWELEGNAEEAEQLFRTALAIDPGNKWAYRQLAEFYSDLGRIEEARALFEQVLLIDPGDPLAAEWLAQH